MGSSMPAYGSAARTALANAAGVGAGYTGTAAQNAQIVNYLNSQNAGGGTSSGGGTSVGTGTSVGGGGGTSSGSGGAPKPTAVVTSSGAQNNLNNTIIPAMKTAQQNMTQYKVASGDTAFGIAKKYNLTPEQFLEANPSFKGTGGPNDYKGLTGSIIPGQTYNIPQQEQQPDMTSTKTNPASDGHVPMWNANGERVDVPIGTTPPEGYTTAPPAPAPVAVNKAFTPQGNYIAQLSDGTYAQFTAMGEKIGQADATMFDNTQKSQNLLSKMNDMALGNNPLNQDQRNQIDGIKQQFQELITQTQTEYANRAGVETIRQNLYGMGNTSIGTGEVLEVVNKGLSIVSSLMIKQASAVSEMITGFKKDNLAQLKAGYDAFQAYEKEIDDGIKNTQEDLARKATARLEAAKFAQQIEKDKRDFAENVRQFNISEANKKAQHAQEIGLGYARLAAAKEAAQVSNQVPPEVVDAVMQNPALINMYSYSMKGKVMNAVIAAAGKSGDNSVGKSILESKLKFNGAESSVKDASKKLTIMTGSEQAAINTMSLAINKLKEIQGNSAALSALGSPKVRKAVINLKKDWGGNADVVEYTNYLVDALNEYGKVIAGQTTGAGVTNAAREEAEKILDAGYNPEQLDAAFTGMRNAMSARTKGLEDSINEATIRGLGGNPQVSPSNVSNSQLFNTMYPNGLPQMNTNPSDIFNNFEFN